MKTEEYYNQRSAIETDIKLISNLSFKVFEYKGETTLFFKSIYPSGKLDQEQIQGILYLMDYGFKDFYVFLTEDQEIQVKIR
jgi:hypothetical protein